MGDTIDANGLGPIRLGMTWDEALAAGAIASGLPSTACWLGTYRGAIVTATDGVVASVTVQNDDVPTSSGVTLGAGAERVLRLVGAEIVDSDTMRAEGLTFGLRNGIVVYIRAGAGPEC